MIAQFRHCEVKGSKIISAVQLEVCLIAQVGLRGIFPPRELQAEKISHLIHTIEHLRTM